MSDDIEVSRQEANNWFDAPKGNVYRYHTAYIDGLLQANSRRFQDYVRFAALYGNWETAQLTSQFLTRSVPTWRQYKRLSFNVCQSMVDTVTNQRASEAPDPLAISSDGDYQQFVRAKLATQAIRAELKANNHEALFPRVCQNALAFGNGYGTVYRANGRLHIKRIFGPELVTDPYDNTCDDWPHSVNHVRYVNKFPLLARYKDKAAAIEMAASEVSQVTRTRGEDNVRVSESWVCATPGKPGRHVCTIGTADLHDTEYEYETPPIVSLAWGMPFQGWNSQGLIDQLVGLQVEINDLLDIIHEAHRLFAHPTLYVENGSNVALSHIQDIPGKVLKYTNTVPTLQAPPMVAAEVYAHLERCYQKAYEMAGINPYAAQAKTLPRLESSKAMRTANAEYEVRHFNFGKACERYHVQLSELICREGAALARETDYKSRVPHSQYFRDIPWREIAKDVENFKIEIDTVNKQNDSAAGKIQDIEDLAQLQALSIPELRRYLQNPDLNRVLRHITASDDYIDYVIYQLAYEEKEVVPEEFMDHATAFREVVAELLTGLRIGMSEKAAENLRNYAVALKRMMDQAKEDAMALQIAAQMQAQAMQAPVQPQQPLTAPGSQQ